MKTEKAKHTPGPWEIQAGINGFDYINAPKMGPGYYHVAHAFGDNARLIAAAPELLSALEGLLNVVEAEPEACGIYKAHSDRARAAIAKAKGDK